MSPLATPPAPPDPTTPGSAPAPSALNAAVTTALGGAPFALVTVWILETYGTAHGQPLKLDSETATAIGAVGAAIIGYLSQVIRGALQLLAERLTRPKE